ncbi:MAG TPA: Y-family DNA polymerase [Paludibacter sp.]
MFALIDCNNFYASCERVFRPELRGKPIVVLSNNDGCVIARSNEAKVFGIPMGAAAFEYEKTFTENNIFVFSSNYALYGDMSARVMNLLATMAPEIEVYSIDEAFLNFEGCDYLDLQQHGLMIVKEVTRSTGIPVSVGIANTKALSKVANKVAKKFPKETGGSYIIDTDLKRIKALKWLPVEDVWGIGHRHAKRLTTLGIKNAYQFTQLPDLWVRQNMAVVGLRLKHELEGKPTLQMDRMKDRKSIATTRSFDKMYSEFDDLRERVTTYVVTCAEKLRRQHSCCNQLLVFVHTNGFRTDLPQYTRNIVMKLPYPTNSSIELARFVLQGLRMIFRKGYQYKKAGVVVMDFTPEDAGQISLFENSDPRHRLVMDVVDRMNTAIGQKKVKLASQALDRTWKMKQEKLSPRYTTRIGEVITVVA